MSILAKAIALASGLHLEQVDKGGKPYILHPLRVMMRLRTDDEELMAIAVLHDVIEDCGMCAGSLRAQGMTERVVDGVIALTHPRSESYADFIDRVCLNQDAMRVKLEDLRDNSDITRLKGITQKDVDRLEKYMVAFRKIQTALGDYQ